MAEALGWGTLGAQMVCWVTRGSSETEVPKLHTVEANC